MKKSVLYVLMLALSMSIFTSCSSDSDEPTQPVVSNDIAGTWKAAPIVFNAEEDFVSGPMYCAWEAPADATLMGMSVSDLSPIIEGLGGQTLAQVLQSVTFNEDGSMSAVYSSEGAALDGSVTPVWENSGTGYITCRQVASNNTLLVKLNLEKIAQTDPDFTTVVSSVPALGQLLANEITLHYTISGNTCKLYVDKAFVMQLLPLLATADELITDDMLDGMGALIKMIISDLPGVLAKTTKLEIGLNLTR